MGSRGTGLWKSLRTVTRRRGGREEHRESGSPARRTFHLDCGALGADYLPLDGQPQAGRGPIVRHGFLGSVMIVEDVGNLAAGMPMP